MQRKITTAIISVAMLALLPGTALAHGGTNSGMGSGGWGSFGGLGLIWPLLLLGLLAVLIYGLVGGISGTREERSREKGTSQVREVVPARESDRALAELRERYARGELSDEEFENRRRTLRTER